MERRIRRSMISPVALLIATSPLAVAADMDPLAPRSADVKIAIRATELETEYRADREAAAKKYDGQMAEVVGVLRDVSHGGNGKVNLNLLTEKGRIECTSKDDYFTADVCPGQTVVLKGVIGTDFVLQMKECDLIHAEPGPKAIGPTCAQLGARYNNVEQAAAFFEKDKGRWVRSEGVIAEKTGSTLLLETGVDCKVRMSFVSADAKFLEPLKVGTTLKFLGQIGQFREPPFHSIELKNCVLREAPTGK